MAAVEPELRRVVDEIVDRLAPIISRSSGSGTLRADIKEAVEEAYRQQFRETYDYIVGRWRGGVRAKSSKTGVFVRRAEVIRFLGGVVPRA
jgi:hypothetical protein